MLDTAYAESGQLLPAGFRSIQGLVGNTPMVSIRLNYRGEPRTVHAKLEYFNLSGSIKDRMALEVLKQAYLGGSLTPGDTITEATSGNAGIAFCALGRALGHLVVIYMPDWMSAERIALMQSYGAEVVLVSKAQGGFLGSIALTEKLAAERDDVFLPRQFSNRNNCAAHYHGTGSEILTQLGRCNLIPDAFVAGVGTGGTVMGVGQALREANAGVKVHPLEPAESPTLSTGHKVGKHRIQGVSDEFIPDIVCLDSLDDVVCVNDGDAILMAQQLSSKLGLAVGISSGANLLGAIKLQNRLGDDAVVTTVFCDDNKKYLSTDLMRVEPVHSSYLTPDTELLSYAVI